MVRTLKKVTLQRVRSAIIFPCQGRNLGSNPSSGANLFSFVLRYNAQYKFRFFRVFEQWLKAFGSYVTKRTLIGLGSCHLV